MKKSSRPGTASTDQNGKRNQSISSFANENLENVASPITESKAPAPTSMLIDRCTIDHKQANKLWQFLEEQTHKQGLLHQEFEKQQEFLSKLTSFASVDFEEETPPPAVLVQEQAITTPRKAATPRSAQRNNSSNTVNGEQKPKQTIDKGDLKTRLIGLEVELEDKTQTVELLQKTLKDQKEKDAEMIRKLQLQESRKLAKQKQELEGTIQRHLGFIDTLLKDKEDLSSKVEALSHQLHVMEKRHNDKIQQLEELHAEAIQKQKKNLIATEKQRRDQFMADKIKQVKESTIKGLEPEIQKIIGNHKQETLQMQQKHQEELQKVKDGLSSEYEKKFLMFRDKLMREKDEDMEKEREKNRVKSIEQNEKIEIQLSNLRKKLNQEHEEERRNYEASIKNLKATHSAEMTELDAKWQQKYKKQVEAMKETLNTEKNVYENKVKQEMQQEVKQQVDDIRKKILKERDDQIELIISKLEEDTTNTQKELESKHQNQLKALQNAIKAQEIQTTDIQNMHEESKKQVQSLQSALAIASEEIAKLKNQLSETTANMAVKEMEHKQEWTQQEKKWQQKVTQMEMQIKNLEKQMTIMKDIQEQEMEGLLKQKESELEQLHERVKKAVEMKDEMINTLKDHLHTAQVKLEQQQVLLEKKRVRATK